MGIGGLLRDYDAGTIDGDQFVEMAHFIALDAAIAGLATAASQTLIPVPLLGTLVGSLAGKFVASALKDGLGKSESALTARLAKYERYALGQLDKDAANAALAWLGGGAVAAGGGGMAAGNALLVLAGPVGWTIGGVALAGSGIYLHCRNGELARRAVRERVEVKAEMCSLRTADGELEGLGSSTRIHTAGSLAELNWLRDHGPTDYRRFDREQKERLAALVNHVRALGELLRAEVAL